MVNRSLISSTDIGEKSIVVTFGNGTSGEYPLATIKVKVDDKEYCLEAAVVQDLVEEVLLGRDVPLCKHLVKRLPREEQMELLQQLARDNRVRLEEVQLEERPKEDDKALAVVTRAQKRARNQTDTAESQEETQENVIETQEEVRDNGSRIQGGIIGMQDDGLMEKEFPFDDELFGEQGKTRPRWTRTERRKHNQQWTRASNGSTSMQLKKEQEEDPSVQKWMAQEDPTRIKRVNGVLCRVWRPRDS